MHFFKRSKIHLDCFTFRRDVIEYAPVVNGIQAIPDWWKKLPKEVQVNGNIFPIATMKTCVGLYDYYNKSIAMPLWSDLCISIRSRNEYSWQFSDKITTALVHSKEQYAGVLQDSNFGHLKLESPWLFNTKSDINWILSDPIYNQKCFTNYVVAQGVLNFSRQSLTNLQLFINTTTPQNFTIPFGSVFLYTPMSDKKVVLHRHLISEEQYKSKVTMSRTTTFISKYKAQQKIIKCPYKDETK